MPVALLAPQEFPSVLDAQVQKTCQMAFTQAAFLSHAAAESFLLLGKTHSPVY